MQRWFRRALFPLVTNITVHTFDDIDAFEVCFFLYFICFIEVSSFWFLHGKIHENAWCRGFELAYKKRKNTIKSKFGTIILREPIGNQMPLNR